MIQAEAAAKRPLQYPAFKRLWAGLTLARLGNECAMLTLVWFLLNTTGSGLAMGGILLCFQLPCIVTGPLIGHLLDKYQPRWIMGVDSFCQACIMLAIPTLFWLGRLETWHIFLLAILSGLLSPASEAGAPVLVPHLVKAEGLEGANALLSLTWEIATLLGPALAGLLVERFGGPLVISFDAAALAAMGLLVLSLPDIVRRTVQQDCPEEARKTARNNWMMSGAPSLLTGLMLLMLFAQGIQAVALAAFSRSTLAAGAGEYGLLLSAFGAGSILGLFLYSRLSLRLLSGSRRPGLVIAAIFILFGFTILPLFLLKSLLAVMACLVMAGVIAAPFFVVERSLVQRIVPKHLQGKFFGARAAFTMAGYPLGGAAAGLLLGLYNAPVVLGLSALVCLITGLATLSSATLMGLRLEG